MAVSTRLKIEFCLTWISERSDEICWQITSRSFSEANNILGITFKLFCCVREINLTWLHYLLIAKEDWQLLPCPLFRYSCLKTRVIRKHTNVKNKRTKKSLTLTNNSVLGSVQRNFTSRLPSHKGSHFLAFYVSLARKMSHYVYLYSARLGKVLILAHFASLIQ